MLGSLRESGGITTWPTGGTFSRWQGRRSALQCLLRIGQCWPLQRNHSHSISLAEWSLNRALFGKKMTNLDFPVVARKDFGIDVVEYVNQFFMDKAEDQAYLADLKKRCDDNGVKSGLIMCDREGAIGDADAAARTKAVENHYKWVTAAKYLGCHSIRVNAQSSGAFGAQLDFATDGLRRLSEFGAQHGINVIVENHGGLSSNGKWLASVIEQVGLPNCGTLPGLRQFQHRARQAL